MPLARCQKIVVSSSTLGLGRARISCCDGEVVPWPWRRRHYPSFVRRYSYSRHSHHNVATTSSNIVEEHVVVDHQNEKEQEGPTVTSEKEGRVSPLIRLESAVIRYPPFTASSNTEFDCGLNDDCSDIDSDLLLESQHSFNDGDDDDTNNHQRQTTTQQQHLQRHWNKQQSTSSVHKNTPHEMFDPFDLNIWPNLECGSGGGGHVVLGRNASGKTLLSRSLVHSSLGDTASNKHTTQYDDHHPANDNDDCCLEDTNNNNNNNNNPFLHSGDLSTNRRNNSKNRNHHFLSHVSFDSHSDLLLNTNTTTVHRALIPSGGNRLSPTAKFLTVRLGMYPLLPRFVNTLSTGEIRRVLLVRALVSKPELLVLDNAFDGLDVAGRKGLQDIIERVLKGFRMDILVQGVGEAKDTARTQVLLLTHRPEEIADGMGKVTFVDGKGGSGGGNMVRTEDRMGRDGEELVRSLVSWEEERVEEKSNHNIDNGGDVEDVNCGESSEIAMHPWDIVTDYDFPSNTDIQHFWEYGKSTKGDATTVTLNKDVLVQATNLKVTCEETTLLSQLNWTVQRGERWHLAGANGAGKSTLSRLLLRRSMDNNNVELWNSNTNKDDAVISDGTLAVVTPSSMTSGVKRGGVGWVSTELHLHATHNWGNRTVLEILMSGASFLFHADSNNGKHLAVGDSSSSVDIDMAVTAAGWLGLFDNVQTTNNHHPFLSRQFSTLSQGQQKLLLVASAIAQRPSLLVLDEPCQGLDLWNRGHLLGLVERICRTTDMSLLYVTHHVEELIPSIGHRLCLEDGEVTYCGLR